MFGETFVVMKWNWVIQSLANFKLVDASTLAGIVKKAPTISDDLGKDARERVSLRILESLFIQENDAIVDTDSAQSSKISFDLSERSEDVLQKILMETSEPMTELEKQKWNVCPFVLHKRALLTQSPLQKFKEALLESSHPILVSLKEKSNLEGATVSENTNTIPEVDVDLNAHTTTANDDFVSWNTENVNIKLQARRLLKPDHVENSTSENIENIGRKELEMSIEPPVKGLEENTLVDHNEHDDLPSVSTSGPSGEGNTLMDNLVTRNTENETNKSQESQLSKSEHVENSTSGIIGDIRRNEHEMSIEPPVKGLEENTMMDHIEHGNLPYVSTSGPSGEGKTLMEDVSQMEIGTDIDTSDDERTDIAAKKEAFLSSQCTLSQDFMAAIDCTEICLCMKCNKDGVLLVCSSDACPIRVHETCLPSAANFDENGNYFCPFCSYSREISKYLEVKKKASLARKDLQAFLSSKFKHRPKVSSKKRADLNRDKSREIGGAGENSEVNGTRNSTISGREESEDCPPDEPTDSLHQPTLKHSRPKRKFNEKGSLSQFKRPRNLEPKYISPTISLARRKILPWTKLEEDTLKEGVERFASVNNKGIPWTLILDFGCDVFDKSRTNIDLKDKWRNICKGIPENKRRNNRS